MGGQQAAIHVHHGGIKGKEYGDWNAYLGGFFLEQTRGNRDLNKR